MKNQVLGFIFKKTGDHVWLIQKTKKDPINGITGNIQINETPQETIEKIAKTQINFTGRWTEYGQILYQNNPNWKCHVFYATDEKSIPKNKEKLVTIIPIEDIQFCQNIIKGIEIIIKCGNIAIKKNDTPFIYFEFEKMENDENKP